MAIAPLLSGGGTFEPVSLWRTGIAHGTDPGHPEFWGRPGDYDQRSVEAAALGFALALQPENFWTPLPAAVKASLAAWLRLINDTRLVDSNWLYFRVLVNLGLRRCGEACDWTLVEADLDRLDTFYLGNGWYSDGVSAPPFRNGRLGDYYVPMAFHFYGLLYATLERGNDPRRAERYIERARRFAEDFVHYFAADGAALPFGRSLTYRFAQGSFWAALAYAGVEALPWGVLKGLYLRHLRWWMRQPILSDSGLLTIGYAYPNLVMAESYNSASSPYWAMKTFLPLALPDTHPFWQAEEAPLPARSRVRTVAGAKLVLQTIAPAEDVVALSPGQPVRDWPRHAPQKYSKFAYSTRLGFCVPTSSATPEEGAFDSMLALSDDGANFRTRGECADPQVFPGLAYSRWLPWPTVEVKTWLLPAESGHIRVHRIAADRALTSAEGGFAVPYFERETREPRLEEQRQAEIVTPAGRAGVRDLYGGRQARWVDVGANGHLLASLSALPLLDGRHEAGEFWLAAFVWGTAGGASDVAQAARWSCAVDDERLVLSRDGVAWWMADGSPAGASSDQRSRELEIAT